jgi:hypothetical protein
MIQDIYIRSPEDPNFQYGILSHSDAIESIITKIKVLFGTHAGQVIGDVAFGLGIEELIFETRINKTQLEQKIKTQFETYISETKDFKITPTVTFGKADGYDYCVIDVYIDDQRVIGILVK